MAVAPGTAEAQAHYLGTVRACILEGRQIPRPPRAGHCGGCDAQVPPAGKVIGFFGAQDTFPVLCRTCTGSLGIPSLVEVWDHEVAAERARRASRAPQADDAALVEGVE